MTLGSDEFYLQRVLIRREKGSEDTPALLQVEHRWNLSAKEKRLPAPWLISSKARQQSDYVGCVSCLTSVDWVIDW